MGMCYYRARLGWGCVGVLPWTLSALVVGCAAAGRGHVITGHTTHQHHHQGSNHSGWLEVSMEFCERSPIFGEGACAIKTPF